MKRAVVVGFGSIGSRHARLLSELDIDVAVVSRRETDAARRYETIADALSDFGPDLVVVASRTGEHAGDLARLASAGFAGTVLVEKPLFGRVAEIPENRFERAFVAFNMRFHPLADAFGKALEGRPVHSLFAYVGQYLPDWRPDSDYRAGYSASRAAGGGVLRDLCHEIDLVRLFGGAPRAATALGGKVSGLEIDSDDTFSLLLELDACPVATITMNYLDARLRRFLVAQTDGGTVCADFAAGILADGAAETPVPAGRDESYRAQLQAVLDGDDERLCSLAGGAAIDAVIEGAERASNDRIWISL